MNIKTKITIITKIIILCLFSHTCHAGDLIFKQGFENTQLVSGQVSGLTSTGLVITLSSVETEQININDNGNFIFSLEVEINQNWQVDIIQLPANPQQQNCILSNNSGIMTSQGVSNVTIQCNQNAWNWNQMNWQEGGWN